MAKTLRTSLPAEMRAAGLKTHEVAGWYGRGHDGVAHATFPGILIHHTGDDAANARTVWNPGNDIRPSVPQPRCNLWFDDADGTWWFIASGRAYQAGMGSTRTRARVLAGTMSAAVPFGATGPDDWGGGNDFYCGIEVRNPGTPKLRHEAEFIRGLRVLMVHLSLTPGAIAHHRQHTRRKPDMAWAKDVWTLVRITAAGGLAPKPVPKPAPAPVPLVIEEEVMAFYKDRAEFEAAVAAQAYQGSLRAIATAIDGSANTMTSPKAAKTWAGRSIVDRVKATVTGALVAERAVTQQSIDKAIADAVTASTRAASAAPTSGAKPQ